MKTPDCLTDDLLLDLYYAEHPDPAAAHRHLAACPACREAFGKLRHDLDRLSPAADPVPTGGERALAAALRALGETAPGAAAPGRTATAPSKAHGPFVARSTTPGQTPSATQASKGRGGRPPVTIAGSAPTAGRSLLTLAGVRPPAGHPPAATGLAAFGEILTLEEVAGYLRLTVEQARRLLGDLPYLSVGGVVRIRRRAFEAWLDRLEEDSRHAARDPAPPVLRCQDLI